MNLFFFQTISPRPFVIGIVFTLRFEVQGKADIGKRKDTPCDVQQGTTTQP
jgi:hypothetical protein